MTEVVQSGQMTLFQVNEEGSEAAAATGVVMMTRCMPAPTPEFTADHAHLLLITATHADAMIPMFYGAISDF